MAWNVKLDMNKYEQFYLNLEQEFSFGFLINTGFGVRFAGCLQGAESS